VKFKSKFWTLKFYDEVYSPHRQNTTNNEKLEKAAQGGLCDSNVSVCHTPVLCLAERKHDREMYTV